MSELEIQEIQQIQLETQKLPGWKMNLLQIHKDMLFIASEFDIYLYKTLVKANQFNFLSKVKISDSGINQIKVAECLDSSFLVAVTMNSQIIVLTLTLSQLGVIENNIDVIGDNSTWSLSCSRRYPIIAVGSNAQTIAFYNILPFIDQKVMYNRNRFVIQDPKAHDHNIPCISFSPCGRYLASVSIDQSCKIWRVKYTQFTDS